jgi:uncharacterized protein (TIGR04222 family)
MIDNPLDWPAEPFLRLYLALAGLAGLAILLLRRFAGGRIDPYPARDLGLLELAWLSGGPARAADTVMLGLLCAGAATIERGSRFVVSASDTAPMQREIRPFRDAAIGTRTRSRFHAFIRARLEPVHQVLMQRGLVAGPDEWTTIRLVSFVLVLIPVLLGTAKICVGLSRGRPIGILLALVIVTAVFGALSLRTKPHRTRSGAAALKRARISMARAIRAPLAQELPLAFAVAGAAVLAGTPYQAFAGLIPSGGDGGGCGGGGGGGGGGGCGGCSGD